MTNMPDADDDDPLAMVWTIIDWIHDDNVNSLSDEDLDSDDDESPGACDEMNGWPLEGEDDGDGEEDSC